jgi:hypothetical protein
MGNEYQAVDSIVVNLSEEGGKKGREEMNILNQAVGGSDA